MSLLITRSLKCPTQNMRQSNYALLTKWLSNNCTWGPSQLIGFVCNQHPETRGSNPEQNIYAFFDVYTYTVRTTKTNSKRPGAHVITVFRVCYPEIMNSDWMFQVTWQFIINPSTLFQHSQRCYVTLNLFTTSAHLLKK